ncbi:MAG: dipeptidase [bacterium]
MKQIGTRNLKNRKINKMKSRESFLVSLGIGLSFTVNAAEAPNTLTEYPYLPPPTIEMKPRPADPKDFPEFVEYLVDVSFPRTEAERATDAPWQEKFNHAHNIDSIFIAAPGWPAGFSMNMYEDFIQHNIDNGFTAISNTVTNGGEGADVVAKRIKDFNQYITDRSDKYMQIKTLDDFETSRKQPQIGIYYNFQGMDPFDEDVANVQMFYDLGVRTALFAYNQDNAYSAGSNSNAEGVKDKGLTKLGAKFVREMNRVGMVVDCSHTSDQTCIDAANVTTRPMIMSHSNVATLQPIARNNSDEAMKAVASTGGAICINFIGGFLNPQGDARPMSIAKHMEYVKNLVGAKAVCAGSDYVYNYGDALMMILKAPDKYPPESGYASPSHMGMPGEIWGAVRVLQEVYGWTDDEIRGLLGENLLRVYRANWQQ